MKYCPRCGSPMHDEVSRCLSCDWVDTKRRKKVKTCPECGDILTRGVCYRCGYRKKHSYNTCPYCRKKLVAGRCKECEYVQPSEILKKIIRIAITVGVCYLLFKYLKNQGYVGLWR